MMGKINIHLGDCVDGLNKQKQQSIDCIVTSPPYKDIDGYSESLINNTFRPLFYLLKDDGLCFVNFGHLVEDKSRPFKVVALLEKLGFKLQETL